MVVVTHNGSELKQRTPTGSSRSDFRLHVDVGTSPVDDVPSPSFCSTVNESINLPKVICILFAVFATFNDMYARYHGNGPLEDAISNRCIGAVFPVFVIQMTNCFHSYKLRTVVHFLLIFSCIAIGIQVKTNHGLSTFLSAHFLSAYCTAVWSSPKGSVSTQNPLPPGAAMKFLRITWLFSAFSFFFFAEWQVAFLLWISQGVIVGQDHNFRVLEPIPYRDLAEWENEAILVNRT